MFSVVVIENFKLSPDQNGYLMSYVGFIIMVSQLLPLLNVNQIGRLHSKYQLKCIWYMSSSQQYIVEFTDNAGCRSRYVDEEIWREKLDKMGLIWTGVGLAAHGKTVTAFSLFVPWYIVSVEMVQHNYSSLWRFLILNKIHSKHLNLVPQTGWIL